MYCTATRVQPVSTPAVCPIMSDTRGYSVDEGGCGFPDDMLRSPGVVLDFLQSDQQTNERQQPLPLSSMVPEGQVSCGPHSHGMSHHTTLLHTHHSYMCLFLLCCGIVV